MPSGNKLLPEPVSSTSLLTHRGIVTHICVMYFDNSGSGNDLLLDDTKPSTVPMVTRYQYETMQRISRPSDFHNSEDKKFECECFKMLSSLNEFTSIRYDLIEQEGNMVLSYLLQNPTYHEIILIRQAQQMNIFIANVLSIYTHVSKRLIITLNYIFIFLIFPECRAGYPATVMWYALSSQKSLCHKRKLDASPCRPVRNCGERSEPVRVPSTEAKESRIFVNSKKY